MITANNTGSMHLPPTLKSLQPAELESLTETTNEKLQ